MIQRFLYSRNFLWTALMLLPLLSGCNRWKNEVKQDTAPMFSGVSRLPVNAVVLEIEIIKLRNADSDLESEMWSELDQQGIKLHTRRQLAGNGIQCGVSASQLPVALQTLVNEHRQAKGSHSETESDDETIQRRMQIRAGNPVQIITSALYPVLSWLVSDDEYLHGEESHQARCQCIVKVFPSGDGGIQLELVPEITHGTSRQRIGVASNALKYEMTQDKHVLNSLQLNTQLALGETFVIGNTKKTFGIGEKFFCDAEGEGGSRKIVLIRLAQTQFDDLFAPDQISPPIATPTD